MAWQGRKVLAVVPARGGSKGIPRKNLCKVGGMSLIAHAARTARALDWIDRAVLSTDDEEMADEGRRHGLEVPFLRPAELASDTASGVDVWRHAWLESERHYGCRFDLSVLLQPTTPLRRPTRWSARSGRRGGAHGSDPGGRGASGGRHGGPGAPRLHAAAVPPPGARRPAVLLPPRGRADLPGARTSRRCTSATAPATR